MTKIGHATQTPNERIRVLDALPFISVHVAAIVGVCVVHFEWKYVALAAATYYLRMFGITAGFHRLASHSSFKTGRTMQFVLLMLGTIAAQHGPLWWAGWHHHHHRWSDTVNDVHSPTLRGFWWSHVGWILCPKYEATPQHMLKNYSDRPEIMWLHRHWLLAPALFALLILVLFGWGGLVWGFFFSTVLLWHGTFTINSLSHVYGSRRYATTDTSRNNWFLAVFVTMGEGWHNNHHHYQHSARQGFYWWEIDPTYYVICALERFGLVWGVVRPSSEKLVENLVDAA